jgi:Flp pilus assembly protein TadD
MLSLKESDEAAFKSDHYHMWNLAKDRNADAVAEVERAYALDPSFLTLYGRAFMRSMTGDADGALAAANTAFGVIGRHPWVLAGLPSAYLQRGQRALGEAIYTELLARAQTEQVSRMVLAFAADQLGRVDEAIAHAIASVEHCDNTGPFWTRAPLFSAAFHAHPRYPELLRAIGL